MRQAIEGVGGEQQPVEQQGVGRHRGFAQSCALHGDQQEHQLQRQAAQEDVAVHRQQWPPRLPALERSPGDLPGVGTKGWPGQGQAEQRSAPFGDHRGPCRTQHAPVQAEYEPQVEGDVQQVGGQQYRQWRSSVLCAKEPADQRITGQRCRQAEQPGMEKVFGGLLQRLARLHGVQGQLAEGQGKEADQ